MDNVNDIIKELEEEVRKGDITISLKKIDVKYQEKNQTLLKETLKAIQQVVKDPKIKHKKDQISLLLEKRYEQQTKINAQLIKERDPLLQQITTVVNDSNISKN